MELRSTTRNKVTNSSPSTEMAGSSSPNSQAESFSSSVAENSSLERLERQRKSSEQGALATDSSLKGRSSLFRKFRSYLSSLVRKSSATQSEHKSSSQEEQSETSKDTEEKTPKRALFDDSIPQNSEMELSNNPPMQTSDERWEVERDECTTEPQQTSVQTTVKEEESYEDSKISSEEKEKNSTTRSLHTPAQSEDRQMNRNYLLESAKSEAKGRTRKHTTSSVGKQQRHVPAQKATISKSKASHRTSGTAREVSQGHEDQLSQALSEDFSETISYQELRSLCKRLGIKAVGKKTELVEKVRSYAKSQETASEASVSRNERSNIQDKENKKAKEITTASKSKREGSKARGKKTIEHSTYSLETVALARAVLQHLQSQERTISVEEYQLYQNILKSAVQKPSEESPVGEYAAGAAASSSHPKKRRRTSPLPKQQKSSNSLTAMKAVEISIEADAFSSQQSLQPSLKRQRIYSMDVMPFEGAEESTPKSSPKVTPAPIRPTVSRRTETTGNTVTPVDVVRTLMGSTSAESDKSTSKLKPAEGDQVMPIAGSAFTTPIISTSRNLPQTTFSHRRETEVKDLKKQENAHTPLLFSKKNDWTKTTDVSGLKRSWDTGKKERVYDFRKNMSPSPARASASDTARKILETLERIAGNSAERKKPPPVTLDSLRKRHRTEEHSVSLSENRPKWNDASSVETEGNNNHYEDRIQNKVGAGSHLENSNRDAKRTKDFSVDLAKDLFAKHIDASAKKEMASDLKVCQNEAPVDSTAPVTKNRRQQKERPAQQESNFQSFPVMSSVTKRLMSDKDAEEIVSSSSSPVEERDDDDDSKSNEKSQERMTERDSGEREEKEYKSTEEPAKDMLQRSLESIDHKQKPREEVTDSFVSPEYSSVENNLLPVVNEKSFATEQNQNKVMEETSEKEENATTDTWNPQNERLIEDRYEVGGHDDEKFVQQSTEAMLDSKEENKASSLTKDEETTVTYQESKNETVLPENHVSVATTFSSNSFSYNSTPTQKLSGKPFSFQTNNIFLQPNSQDSQAVGTSVGFLFSSASGGNDVKANNSQTFNSHSTGHSLEAPVVGFAQPSFSTSQPKESQSVPSLFSASAPLFSGTSMSSSIFTSSTTFPTTTTFQSPFSTSSFSGAFSGAFSTSPTSAPGVNPFTSSQQTLSVTNNQLLSSGSLAASSNTTSSFSSPGFQGFAAATASTDIFSKSAPVGGQETATATSLFSASPFSSNAFSSVPNPFSTVSPFSFGSTSSPFSFGATSSSASFPLNTSPFSSQAMFPPQSSPGMDNNANPFTAPFQFNTGSNMPLFSSSGASNMPFTSSFALGSQNTTTGRKMVRARRLRH